MADLAKLRLGDEQIMGIVWQLNMHSMAKARSHCNFLSDACRGQHAMSSDRAPI